MPECPDVRLTLTSDVEQAIHQLQQVLLRQGVCPLHDRGALVELRFQGHYGAPGTGSHWQCAEGHDWSKVGNDFYRSEEQRHIMTEKDVI